MPYVGNATATTFSTIPSVQRFNGDGSDTTFTLSQTVTSVQDILVSVDGVVQDSNAYTVPDGTTLTFSAAPSSGTGNIFKLPWHSGQQHCTTRSKQRYV